MSDDWSDNSAKLHLVYMEKMMEKLKEKLDVFYFFLLPKLPGEVTR